MSITSVQQGICAYFGGPYDPVSRTYRTPAVAGLGVVRRAWPKRDNHQDFFNDMAPGARTGCQMIVWISRHREFRAALGGEHSGMKRVIYEVELNCYLRSRSPHAEDAQDDVYALREAIVEYMRADRTLGGACFQAGEYVEGANTGIQTDYGQPDTKAELTKSFMLINFVAVEYVFA